MNVVVLGAGSFIGTRIAAAFSEGNDVFLISRETNRIELAAAECRKRGARSVATIQQDLREGILDALAGLGGRSIDVLVNVASATSRLRDNEILDSSFEDYVAVDLLSPLRLIQRVVGNNGNHPLHIVFISSFLTLVKSPNRSIYSSLKILQEEYLKRLEVAHAGASLTVVRVSKVIPPDRDSRDAAQLAEAVLSAYRQKKKAIFFGGSGFVLTVLFYIQPILFRAVMTLQRSLRAERQPS